MNSRRHMAGILLVLGCTCAQGQELGLRGQLSTWATLADENPEGQLGLRYIPELSLSSDLSGAWRLDAEAALDFYGYGQFDDWDEAEWDGDVDPYRLWLRLASPQFEARAGLQKISFGSATLLRPLMWFDTLDPRDPLQLSDGVYGLLGRYTFLNNANVWLWTLYGNDELRGWETVPTEADEPEFGGRLQVPASAGELALSYHHRRADPAGTALEETNPEQGDFSEDRVGLDGKWDVVVGLWFEATLTRQDLDAPLPKYQRLATFGADYTFPVGSGLHLLGEHFVSEGAEEAFGNGDRSSISAFSCDYPLGLFDSLAAYVYYDWDGDTWSPTIQWRRTYDQWQIHVSAFHAESGNLPDGIESNAARAGNGVQLMLVFNH